MSDVNWGCCPLVAQTPIVRAFIEQLAKERKAQNTIENYSRDLNDFLCAFPELPFSDLLEADESRIADYVDWLWKRDAQRGQMMVSTRLWLGGVVSLTRDTKLADRLLQRVRACCQTARDVLICTDGWAAYPGSIRRAFRDKVKWTSGRGRASLEVWSGLYIGTVIKHPVNKRLREVVRHVSYGSLDQAMWLLQRSQGGQVFNTSFIERFNGTMSERLASLTRKCRHAAHRLPTLELGMYLVGSTYNFCCAHQALEQRTGPEALGCQRRTPAMVSGLTDHLWSMQKLLQYQVAPPPWSEPKRRGRPRTRPLPDPNVPKRPRGRPRTQPVVDPFRPKRLRGRPRKVPLNPFTG